MKPIFFLAAVLLSIAPAARAAELEDVPWDRFVITEDSSSAVRLLGTWRIGPTEKTYRKSVANCANDLSAVKLSVKGAGVTATNAGVRFADGREKTFRVNRSWGAGSESSWLSLGLIRFAYPGCIREVVVSAHSDGGIATVQVFGRLK